MTKKRAVMGVALIAADAFIGMLISSRRGSNR